MTKKYTVDFDFMFSVQTDDPENLQKELIDTIRMIDATQRSAEVNYGDVLLRQAEIEG